LTSFPEYQKSYLSIQGFEMTVHSSLEMQGRSSFWEGNTRTSIARCGKTNFLLRKEERNFESTAAATLATADSRI